MFSLPELLPEKIIEKAKKLNTPILADSLGFSYSMDYKINPIRSGMKMVGTALTVNMAPGDNLFLQQAIHLGKEGYILVADGKDHRERAYFGGLMGRATKARGIEGVVIDGLIRDKKELLELNLPVFAKGFIPNGPFKNGPGEIGTPISCGNVPVNPGDLIFGDDDGVVCIPRKNVEYILDKASEELNYEKNRVKTIDNYVKTKEQGLKPNSIEPSWLKEKMKKFID